MIIKKLDIFSSSEEAHITAYLQPIYPDCPLRPAIIICPGGSYHHIGEKESEPAALGFFAQGYNAFVLSYSTGLGRGNLPVPIVQIAKTIAYIRENAKSWRIDPDSIALCGFSAGGHAAAAFGALWNEKWLEESAGVETMMFKPNALLLCYPLLDIKAFCDMHIKRDPNTKSYMESIYLNLFAKLEPSDEELSRWDIKKLVNRNMPPVFLWTTFCDDIVDVSQSIELAAELAKQGIPFEYHVFEKGPHALSGADALSGYIKDELDELGNAPRWRELALKWLSDIFERSMSS